MLSGLIEQIGNLPEKISSANLIKFLKEVITSLRVTGLAAPAERSLATYQVFWKDNQPVSLDEFTKTEEILRVPMGTWSRYSIPGHISHDILRGIGFTRLSHHKNVTVIKLVDNSVKEKITAYYAGDLVVEDLLGIHGLEKKKLDANLLPIIKKLQLKLSTDLDIVKDDQGTLDRFDNAYKLIPIVKFKQNTWVQVPPKAIEDGYLDKYYYYGYTRDIASGQQLYFLVQELTADGCHAKSYVVTEDQQLDTFYASYLDNDQHDEQYSALNALIDKLGLTGGKPVSDGTVFWTGGFVWPAGEAHPVNLEEWALKQMVVDLGPDGKVYRLPAGFRGRLVQYFFGKSYKSADKYYAVVPTDAPDEYRLRNSGFIAVNNKGRVVGTSDRLKSQMLKIAETQMDRILGVAPGTAPVAKLARGKVIKPESRFHSMLRYIQANPGQARSAWVVAHLGYRPEQMMMGSIGDKKSTDGFAYANGLVTVRDEGRKPNTYQMRITPRGEKILDRLNAGESVPVADIVRD